jgi:hypothetical protein
VKTINSAEIERIYRDLVAVNDNDEYAGRYSKLPLRENNKKWKWEGKDFPRIISLLEFAAMVRRFNLAAKSLLTFTTTDDPELEYLPYLSHYNFDFDDDKVNHDLHTLNVPRRDYDFVMLNQTLEHLYNPFVCLDNVRTFLGPGAIAYANVPSINIAHSTPYHFYTGYTPTGLACVFQSCGFEILEVGQWGNKEYIDRMFKTQGWPDYRALKSFRNDFLNPVITWILARKP